MAAFTNAPDPKKSLEGTDARVQRQLEQILADSLFRRSQHLSSFLRYVVETALSGEVDRLKELVIGAEVFKRGDSFDRMRQANTICTAAGVGDAVMGWTNKRRWYRSGGAGVAGKLSNWWPNTKPAALAALTSATSEA